MPHRMAKPAARELQNVLERATLLAGDDPGHPGGPSARSAGRPRAAGGERRALSGHTPDPEASGGRPRDAEGRARITPPQPPSPGKSRADHIRKALALNAGNKSHTARMLGISREGLRIKLSRFNMA